MATTNTIIINKILQVTAAQAIDYSTLLIVDCNHLSFDRTTTYGGVLDYATTIPSESNLAKALNSAFSVQTPPSEVVAGRAKGTAILSFPSVAETDAFDATITVLDGETVTASYVAAALDDAEVVATALKADIDAITDITDHVTATVVGTGVDAVLEISLVTDDDDFTVTNITDTIVVTGRATEPALTTLVEIENFNPDWTFIVSTDHTPSYQLSMAEAATLLQQPYFTSSNNSLLYSAWDGESTPDSNDIAALFAFNQYDYAHVTYHHQADDYPEAARLTRFSTKKPGTSNYQYKAIGNFPLAQISDSTRALNTTELVNLKNKNCSTVINEGGEFVIGGYQGRGNRMASGKRIETIAFSIYASQEIKRRLSTLNLRFDKLAMNDKDFNLMKSVIAFFLDQNVSIGAGQAQALNPIKPYTITFPKASEIPFEDKADGILQNVKVVCYLDPSIDRSIIDLTFTFLDPALEAVV